MKKIYTQLSLYLFVFTSAYSQLPNPSFETWQPYPSGEYPTSWVTSDSISEAAGAGHNAEKEASIICDGSFSVKLTTVTVLITNYLPGVATNGKITGVAVTNVVGGSPYTIRSAQFAGCYKYTPANAAVDSGIISAVLTKWNGTSRDTVALAKLITHANGGLTNFLINFTYNSGISPDTVLVLLATEQGVNATTTSGSQMIVDNLHFVGVVIGIDENSLIKDIHVFPQPAQNELNIQVELNQNISLKYEIADITGRKIISGKMASTNEKVDISILSRGNYFIALRNDENAVLYTSKFIVSK